MAGTLDIRLDGALHHQTKRQRVCAQANMSAMTFKLAAGRSARDLIPNVNPTMTQPASIRTGLGTKFI